eukprot:m.145080 g.145080  ORF g.145080 m.145080 type:complete len:331 (-) comp11615_c0_seq2:571-1563(-)
MSNQDGGGSTSNADKGPPFAEEAPAQLLGGVAGLAAKLAAVEEDITTVRGEMKELRAEKTGTADAQEKKSIQAKIDMKEALYKELLVEKHELKAEKRGGGIISGGASGAQPSEGAGLDPLTTPVSQCLGDDKWAQKLREVFADDLFTVSELKAYTLDEFVDILAQMGVLVYLAKPIAVRIGNVWPNVFKEGGASGAPPSGGTDETSDVLAALQSIRIEIANMKEAMPSGVSVMRLTPSGASVKQETLRSLITGLRLNMDPLSRDLNYTTVDPSWRQLGFKWSQIKLDSSGDRDAYERASYPYLVEFLASIGLVAYELGEGQKCPPGYPFP